MVQLREDNGLKSCSTNAVGEQRTTLGSIQEAKSEQVFKMKERRQILKYLQLDQKEMQKVEKEEKKKTYGKVRAKNKQSGNVLGESSKILNAAVVH